MMKIKREVEMNLPQLIEWAWGNDDATGVRFQSDGFVTTVYFGKNGDVSVEDCSKDERFTITTEEEIDEDTFFKHLIKVTEDGEHYSTGSFKVRDLIHLGTEEIHAYVDGEYKLIWTHEKGLVIE